MTDNVKHCWPTVWLEAAQKAGIACQGATGGFHFVTTVTREGLEAFATAIQEAATAAEREACAKVCEEERVEHCSEEDGVYNLALVHAALAIRAR